MVSLKTLLIGTAALCYSSSVMAAAAIASASASHMAAHPSSHVIAVAKQQQGEGTALKEQAFDDLSDFLGNVIFPVALDKQCKSLTFVSKNLDNILKRYVGLGLVCSDENRKLIDRDVVCSTPEGNTDFISQVVFPLALNQLQEMAEKIRAQTQCLDYLLTGNAS